MARNDPRKGAQRGQRMSEEVQLADIESRRIGKENVGLLIRGGIGFAWLWVIYKMVDRLAGKDTGLNVHIAVTWTVSVTLVGVATSIVAWRKHQRAVTAENRVRDLTRDVRELQARLREHGHDDKPSRG